MVRNILCLVAWFCVVSSSAQIIETITVDFTKVSVRQTAKDTVRGTICYQDKKMIVKVIYPLQQRMVLEGTNLLLYYPAEGRAIRILSENPVSLPFFQTFLGLGQDYNNLENLGFFLAKTETRGDTLQAYWLPKNAKKGQGGQFVLKAGKDRLYVSEYQDSKRPLLMRTTYDRFYTFGKNNFPLEMTSQYRSDRDSLYERIVFDHPSINKPIPEEFISFSIPAHIEIKEITW